MSEPVHEHIQKRAYFIWLDAVERGDPPHGNDWRDWFEAECKERWEARCRSQMNPFPETHGKHV